MLIYLSTIYPQKDETRVQYALFVQSFVRKVQFQIILYRRIEIDIE